MPSLPKCCGNVAKLASNNNILLFLYMFFDKLNETLDRVLHSAAEMQGKKYLLNTPILTDFGMYTFEPATIVDAQAFIGEDIISAIGHQATADALEEILGEPIPMNRIQVKLEKGDVALVFRLKTRLPEGKVLTADELKALEWDLGFLTRVL